MAVDTYGTDIDLKLFYSILHIVTNTGMRICLTFVESIFRESMDVFCIHSIVIVAVFHKHWKHNS